jgi:hypothetical protein
MLNDLAAPMEIMAMSLTEVKDELREIKSGMNYHCNLCASPVELANCGLRNENEDSSSSAARKDDQL